MRHDFRLLIQGAALCAASLANAMMGVAQTLPDGPYFGQTPPGMTPEIFAPGIISLANRRETKVAFTPDGQQAFLGTAVNGSFTIFHTTRTGDVWSPLATPSFIGNANAEEPALSPDGKTLFFVRATNIWTSQLIAGAWTQAAALPSPINLGSEEWYPSSTADGTLYFASSRVIGNNLNIWRSTLVNGAYASPEKLPSNINFGSFLAADPVVSPDERFMVFSSRRPGGFGSADQWISYRQPNGDWSDPANLGALVNTSGIEYAASFSPDGKYFFFSRPSGYTPTSTGDIYWVDARALGISVPEPGTEFLLSTLLALCGLRRRSTL